MAGVIITLLLVAAVIYAATQVGGVITLAFIAALLLLAYRRLSLLAFTLTFTALLGIYTEFGTASVSASVWKGLLWSLLGLLWLVNLVPLRKLVITRPFMKAYLKLLPAMSQRRAPCGGMANFSQARRTGKSCSPRRRRSSPRQSRRSSMVPARSCVACSMIGTSRIGVPTCRRRCGSS